MTATQTPLLGQENTPLHSGDEGTGFESATPRHDVTATPNPLATPRGMATPRSVDGGMGQTPMRTPMRDSLSINDSTPMYGATPQEEKRRMAQSRRALKAGFASLPAPENNFELAEEDEEEEEADDVVMTVEDAAERDARLKAAREEEERKELERRSSVVKRSLPRPANVDQRRIFGELSDGETSTIIQLINFEMAALMKHDSLAHPLPGSSAPSGMFSDYDMPDDDYVDLAKKEVHAELAQTVGLPGANESQLRIAINAGIAEDAFDASWAKERENLILHPSLGWVESESLSPTDLTSAYSHMINASKERMIASATTAAKGEKKLAKQLGGYQAINAKVRSGILDAMNDIHATKRELEIFLMLKGMEEAGAPGRLERKREEVAVLERRERDLQARYAELNDERRERVEAIEQVRPHTPEMRCRSCADQYSSRKTRSCCRRSWRWTTRRRMGMPV
jgi:pre-mRNA-splicing factor CDC5/CEF1